MNNMNFFKSNNKCFQNNYNKSCCPSCPTEHICSQCPAGATGPQGEPGSILNSADFYALMPPDNSATVAPGTAVSFPQDGPSSGSAITTEPALILSSWHKLALTRYSFK